MENQQMVMIAAVVGMVVGFFSGLAVAWVKTLLSKTTTEKLEKPAPVKVKRAYKRKTTVNVPDNRAAVTATTSSNPSKKRGGRPTNAEVAQRQATAAKLVKDTTAAGSTLETNPDMADQQFLLKVLSQLSPEQLHALQSLPIVEATYLPAKEILTT